MAVPRTFSPTVELPQIQQAIQLYQQHPDKFTDQDLDLLKNHAEYYHLPFAEDEESQQGRVTGLISQLGSGFVSGFSTLNVGKAPRDEYESIARNLGHLAGFVGFVPAKPFQLLNLRRLTGAAKALQGRSIPMIAAKAVTEKAGKLVGGLTSKSVAARAGATTDALSFLQKPLAKDLIEGSFHLGVASAVSSWQEGIDGMMQGFIGGAQAGVVFRGIGNFVKTGDKSGDKILRGLSASLFMGLPSTMRGATTPEQIYEYVLGAYFGVKEAPYHRRAAGKHLQKMTEKGNLEPETIEGWEKLDAKTQKTVQEAVEKQVGDRVQVGALQYALAIEQGKSPEEAQKLAESFIKDYKAPEYTEEGELIADVKISDKDKVETNRVLEGPKREDNDLSNHRDDTDTGTEIQRFTVNTENFVKDHLENIWKDKKNPRSLINVAASAIETRWKELYEEAREVTKTNPSPEIIEFIQDNFGTVLESEAKNYWRQQGERRLKARPVKMLSGILNPYKNDEYELIELEYGVDTNLAGNRKRLLEPSKLLDLVYRDQFEKVGGESYSPEKHGRPYMVLDHIVMHTPRGLKEVSIDKIQQEYINYFKTLKNQGHEDWIDAKNKDIEDIARNRKDEVIAKNIMQMNKSGYYYFGGKGDAARQYFVRYHPLVESPVVDDAPITPKTSMPMNFRDGTGGRQMRPEFQGKSTMDLIFSGDRTATSRSPRAQKDIKKGDVIEFRGGGTKVLVRATTNEYSLNDITAKEWSRLEGWDTKRFESYKKRGYKQFQFELIKDAPITIKKPTRGYKTQRNWNNIVRILQSKFKQHNVKDEVKKDMERWARKMGLDPKDPVAIDMYKSAYVSNILYELGMNGFKNIDDPDIFNDSFKQVISKSYINDPKGFNKRAQIWFTTGFSSNPEYISEKVKDLEDGMYKSRIVKDSVLDEVYSDGAILGRSDVIDAMNSDWGMPLEGKANKSFIVSPNSEHGALLGKYMIHSPSPKIEKWMKQKGIHFIIPKTAAKQYGTRKVGEEIYTSTGGYNIIGGEVYKIPAEHFKGIFSEKVDKHNAEWVNLPKQMMSNLTPFNFNPTPKDAATIEDMYNTLNRKQFMGEKDWNAKLEKLIQSPKDNENLLPELEKNFDKLGVDNILRAIQAKGNEKFANLAYAKVQRGQMDILENLVAEGEIDRKDADESMAELTDTLQIHQKIKAYAPDSLLSVFHKWSFPYLETSLRNYIVQTLTRPKVANSFSSRMRPYDIVMQNEGATQELKNNKELFFLDDGFKSVKIRSSYWKNTKSLGDVWKMFKDPENQQNKGLMKELESILEATLVRVPMDSLSGAHVLKFGGFTGIKGYGSVLHKETMKALGGADLDGDKAFGFFGGNKHGFKDSWKDLYKRQREEYKGKSPEKVKEEYRKELGIEDDKILSMVESPVMQYSPYVRGYVSEAAATGRNQLGPAVVSRAVLNAAYSSLREMDKDGKTVDFVHIEKDKKGPEVRVELKPRVSEEAMNKFREKARAIIAMTSDPMDEAGIKGVNELFNSLFNEAFRFEPYTIVGKKKNYEMHRKTGLRRRMNKSGEYLNGSAVWKARQKFISLFQETNSRLYGKNWREGKRWTFDEIHRTMEKVNKELPEEYRNNFLGKLAGDMRDVVWRDRVLARVDYDKLGEMYGIHSELVKDNKYQRLMRLLGRKTMKVEEGNYIDLVRNHNLHTEEGRNRVITGDKLIEALKATNKKDRYIFTEMEGGGRRRWEADNLENGYAERKYILDKILNKASDFIVNDMSDIASMNTILRHFEPLTNREQALKIVDKVSEFKSQSYLMGRNRRDMEKVRSANLSPKQKDLLEKMDREFGDSPVSAMADQASIDAAIRKYKGGLTEAERDFFDSLMLGSVNRGRHDIIERYKDLAHALGKTGKKPGRMFWARFDEIAKKADNTTMSRLGFASQEVSPRILKEHMKEFSELFDNSSTKLTEKETAQIKSEAEIADKPRPIVDENGNVVEGSILEAADYDEATQKYLDEYAPFAGLKEGTLKGEYKELFYKLKNHLDYYHNGIGKNLNGLVRSVLNKDLNAMNLEDFRVLDRYFNQIRNGTWWQRLTDKVQTKYPQLSKWDYLRFPEAVNRNMMRKEIDLVDEMRPYKDKWGNTIVGKAMRPTGIMDSLQFITHTSQENAIQMYEEEKKNFRSKLRPYLESIEMGGEFFELAVRKMETGLKNTEKANYDYFDLLREVEKKYNWKELKDKSFIVTTPQGKIQMTGERIRNSIMDIMKAQNERVHKWLVGDEAKIKEYTDLIKTTLVKNPEGYHNGLLALKRKFIKDIEDSFTRKQPFDIGLGMDGLSKVSKRVMLSQIPKYNRVEKQRFIEKNLQIEPTGKLPTESYFPHIQFDRVKARERMLESLERVAKDNSLSKDDKAKRLKSLIFHYKQLTGDWASLEQNRFGQHWDKISDAIGEITEQKKKRDELVDWFKASKKVRNQFKRSKEPIPGWEVSPEAYESYMKSIVDAYYRLSSEVAARASIIDWRADFYNRTKDPVLTNSWANYLNLYVQGAMGYNEKIPKRMLDDPNMKMKGTPYSWFADSTVLNRINKIADKLGVQKGKSLPPEFQELGKFSFEDLSRWTNMEAKYQLASLLAHPKSSIANLYGGTVHTLVSTGWDNFSKARKIKYLQTHVNPKWQSMADVEDWVKSHGVIEEFLLYEADINPQMKGKKWTGFIAEATEKIRKNPEFSDTSLRELWRKHGITDAMFDKAAWFMRRPERTLRRDSFVAHYLQAREKFGSGIRDYDHPFLIELAKKGVKSTQFLYSAPFRPMFARTALGKVMTRFQLWSWNSVRFRNQVLKEAELRGWKPGTQEFKRFQRLATTDLFTLGLSSVFMYSLFENALPAPWNWFQDVSDLMFGDDKDRERAFFGAYPYPFQPLQMVTPPVARLLPPLFKGMVTDDYSKLANYYIWTMFPFGRLGRDVLGEGGLLQNPAYGIEKMTGLPYTKFASELKGKHREKEGLEIPKPRGLV